MPRLRPLAGAAALASSLALATAPVAAADGAPPAATPSTNPAADIAALRAAMEALRAEHAARMADLERRLRAAEAAIAPPAQAAEPAPAPAVAAAPASANAFNPALSLILSGAYQRSRRDPADYRIAGFRTAAGAELGPGGRGFNLGESELGLAASIDPWWQGAANVSLHGDDTVSVEEAWVQTTALGNGATLKAGRMLSGIGYLNGTHAHTWSFADAPLAYQAMLGGQLAVDGAQARWLAPTDQYLELSAELGRGLGGPADGAQRNGAGLATLALHTGGDVGDSHAWRAGLSLAQARADGQALSALDGNGQAVDALFSGRTRVWVVDGLWKWAPGGNATRQSLTLQGEWLWATRRGSLADAQGANGAPWRSAGSGGYLQAVWQFMPRWRVGLRSERLDPGRDEDAALLAGSGFRPTKTSAMLDFSASEFSRLRLQVARDRAQPGAADTQWTLQYQMSLGAHGAHAF